MSSITARPLILFGPKAISPAHAWTAADFHAVDDRVRGGSSQSYLQVIGDEAKLASEDEGQGEAEFSGFLDTTTLGGAGFASQLYPKPFPQPVTSEQYRGLQLSVRLPEAKAPKSATGTQPGGGKERVSHYVLGLKTTIPEQRPDGRRESAVVYEWKFEVPRAGLQNQQHELIQISAEWPDFKPFYRGRPKDDAPKLDPSQVKEWHIMARSDFGAQSGDFALRLVQLSAIPCRSFRATDQLPSAIASLIGTSADEKTLLIDRDLDEDLTAAQQQRGSGEYYGFALFLFATLLWVGWTAWALLPDSWLHAAGIEWYPNREWAYLVPAWSLVTVLSTYAGFLAWNMHCAAPLEDLTAITDSHANVYATSNTQPPPLRGIKSLLATGGDEGALAGDLYDLPPGLVSKLRFSTRD